MEVHIPEVVDTNERTCALDHIKSEQLKKYYFLYNIIYFFMVECANIFMLDFLLLIIGKTAITALYFSPWTAFLSNQTK